MLPLDQMELCRLCLVKEQVNIPIFEDEGDVRQIFFKIAACLPVKVAKEDNLPKKICDDCLYKLESFYDFWNTTANAEKQLLEWLDDGTNLMGKQTDFNQIMLTSDQLKQERISDTRIDRNTMKNQNNMGRDTRGRSNQRHSGMDTSGDNVQMESGMDSDDDDMGHHGTSMGHQDDSDDGSEEAASPVKQEILDDQSGQILEPSAFVTVTDEAGPSGLQQHKIEDMNIQPTDNDPKTGDPKVCRVEKFYNMWNKKEGQKIKGIKIAAKKRPYNLTKPRSPRSVPDKYHEYMQRWKEKCWVRTTSKRLKFQCSQCKGAKFKTKQLTIEHYMNHHSRPEMKCDECDMTFETIASIQKHIRSHQAASQPGGVKKYDNKGEDRPSYYCDQCQYETKCKYYLKTHFTRKHGNHARFECDHCGRTYKVKEDLRAHMGVHLSNEKHMCDICGRFYATRSAMNAHRRVAHLNIYTHSCGICKMKLLSQKSLDLHMRNHADPIICDECGYKFTKREYLSRHKKRVHRVEKTNLCNICGKSFVCSSTLRIHSLIHTKARPYRCNVCGNSFTQRSSMMLHWRRKHPDAGDPPPPVLLKNLFDPGSTGDVSSMCQAEISEPALPFNTSPQFAT